MKEDNSKKKYNIPLIVIGASIPIMWILVAVLSGAGFFDFLDNTNLSEFMITLIVVLIANIPVLVFIGYGIYNAATSPSTIPKVKERMPWDNRSPSDIDREWREKLKENEKL